MIDFNQYTEMCDVLTQWAREYAAGTPSVSDDVYDKNYILLKEFEAANPNFILDTSPTRHVEDGADGFRKVRHDIPMISISNSNGIDETREWAGMMFAKGVKRLEGEYKLDGLSLALKYHDGQLVDAVTRGKDNVGDSVFENALRVKGVLHKIPWLGDVEIRGETVWKYADFEPINDLLAAEGKKAFANPRNGAAGTLKMHDPDEIERRGLSFVAYLAVKGSPNRYQSDDIASLRDMGFEVPKHWVAMSVDELVMLAENMREKRYEQPYTIDGVVLKVDDKEDQARFGYTAKSPNFYRAYKFPPEEKETELLDIEQSIGMSGAITPVAIINPVHLAMTTVSRCSLHNWDLVDYLGLHKGCHVVIRKAGEIIPELVKCVETGRSKDTYEVERDICDRKKIDHVSPWEPATDADRQVERYSRPTNCPCCGGPLACEVNADGKELVSWVCSNEQCKSQIGGKLANFVSRDCMNIMGVGDTIVEQLLDAGKVTFFDDIYRLTEQDLVDACGKSPAGAQKLLQSIEKSKGNYLHQLVEGFSVPGLGHQVAPAVAKCIGEAGGLMEMVCGEPDLEQAARQTFADSAETAGVSQIISARFLEFVERNKPQLRALAEMGVAQEIKQVQSAKLAGKVCIMTGTFERLDRDVFKDMVVANGGTICSSITKKCNVVLMGDNAGPSKLKKIDELKAAGQQIDIYTPETLQDFLSLME